MNTNSLLIVIFLFSVAATEAVEVTLEVGDRQAVFNADGVDLATYHVEPLSPPDGIDPMYARSGFIHPFKTPTGRTVTDDFPPDHAHQNGLFSTWTKVTFRGKPVDFWNRHKKLGAYRHAGFVWGDGLTQRVRRQKRSAAATSERPPFLRGGADVVPLEAGELVGMEFDGDSVVLADKAAMAVNIEHVVLGKDDEPDTVALREHRTYLVSVVDGATVIDVHSIQRAATDDPVIMEKHLYGGFAVRARRNWTAENAAFLTSEGGDRTANHSRPEWVALSGPTEDGPATVAVVAHPTNFRHPCPVRLHPAWPYFTFAACVEKPFSIERGRPLEARYRVMAFDGPANAERIEKLAESFR